MKKRLLAVFLALALCVGLTVPAFAAGTKKVVEDLARSMAVRKAAAARITSKRGPPRAVTKIGRR